MTPVSYVVTSQVPNKIWKNNYFAFALKSIQVLDRKTSKKHRKNAVCKVDFERKKGAGGGVRRAAKKNFRVFGGFGRVDLSRQGGNWVAIG